MIADEQGDDGPPPEDDGIDRPTGFGDAIAGALCLAAAAIGAFLIVPAWVYVPEKVAGTIDSPAVMPLLMLALLALFGAVLLAQTVRNQAASESHRTRRDWMRAGGMIAVCGLYLALILIIGLPVATVIALTAAMFYFGERRWRVVLPVAVATPLLLWTFFAYVVQVPMPQPLLRLGAAQSGPAIESAALSGASERGEA